MLFSVYLTLMLVLPTRAANEDPIVHTPLGSIKGRWQFSRSGRPFEAYEGIPYAKPPVQELRFEPPQPINSWQGVLHATGYSPKCIQYAIPDGNVEFEVIGDEDCLYMHVYTNFERMSNGTKLLPVIIYIYGSGFQISESLIYRPHFLMDNDLVFVSMNHRLGPFGFLSTGDGVVPGNMGMKDQVLAMKWVSMYITLFGGNPNQVTLAGLSSGGASVHFHLLSPMSRGLFHRGISSSGSAFNAWALNEASSEKSKKLAALMECPTSDNELMIRCLKSCPATNITDAVKHFLGYLYTPFVPFGPVIENGSSDPFLDKPPVEIICSGGSANVPWIMSLDTEDGTNPSGQFFHNPEQIKDLDENWEVYAPYILDYNYTIPKSEHASVAKRIRHHYLGNKHIDNSNRDVFIHMCGDRLYASAVILAAKEQVRLYNSSVWFYIYGHRGEYSTVDPLVGPNKNYGVGHGDESFILFDQPGKILHRKQDRRMSSEMVKMWYSFANTGILDMGVNWTRVNCSSDKFDYLMISGPGQYVMKSEYNVAEVEFWMSIDFHENKTPLNFSNCPRFSELNYVDPP